MRNGCNTHSGSEFQVSTTASPVPGKWRVLETAALVSLRQTPWDL